MSHFSDAESLDQSIMKDQVEQFKKMYYQILDYGHNIRYRHIGNSAAIMTLEDNFFNAWRPGLALYGYNPLPSKHPQHEVGKNLKPALKLTSRIIALQTIKKGEGVSYNKTWISPKDTIIATIPFGYKEGLPRAASNKISFMHGQTKLQQVGNICMNLCSVDCGKHHVKVGDEIELISPDPTAPNNLEKLAAASGTISYECLVRLDPTMRREIVG